MSTKDLQGAAEAFESASNDSQELVAKLDKVTEKLKSQWSGAAQETFYKHYDEWEALMKGQAALLTGIAFELRALAERYERADK